MLPFIPNGDGPVRNILSWLLMFSTNSKHSTQTFRVLFNAFKLNDFSTCADSGQTICMRLASNYSNSLELVITADG